MWEHLATEEVAHQWLLVIAEMDWYLKERDRRYTDHSVDLNEYSHKEYNDLSLAIFIDWLEGTVEW